MKQSASFVVIYCRDTTPKILGFIRKDLTFGLFGGKAEQGEDEVTCLLREVNEEAGIELPEQEVVKLLQHNEGNLEINLFSCEVPEEVLYAYQKKALLSNANTTEGFGVVVIQITDETKHNLTHKMFLASGLDKELVSIFKLIEEK